MPTGVHLPNARELLFEAAEQVLARDGVSGLTSRAVTTEAGVAKGVMHRHFVDFDAFLAELILDRAAQLEGVASALRDAAGAGTVVGNLADALTAVFTPLAVAMVALVITRDRLRARLPRGGGRALPADRGGVRDGYRIPDRRTGTWSRRRHRRHSDAFAHPRRFRTSALHRPGKWPP